MNWLRKNWLTLLQVLFSVFLLYRVFGDASLRGEAAALMARANPWWVVAGIAIALAGELLCAVRWSLMLKVFGVPLGFGRVCAFSLAGLFYSFFFPGAGGGDAFRIIYVIRLYPDQKRRAVMSVIADRLCGLVALVIALGIAFVFRGWFPADTHARSALNVSLTVLSVPVVLVFFWWLSTFPRMQKKGAHFIPRRVRRPILVLGENFWKIVNHPQSIFTGVAVSCAALAAHFTTYFFSALAFGVSVSLAGMFLVMPVVDALILLPVTFFGIGLRETLFQGLLGGMFGVSPGAATLVAMGGFGFQAAVGLLGGLLVPFTTPARRCAPVNAPCPADRPGSARGEDPARPASPRPRAS